MANALHTQRAIPSRERLIFPLDVPSTDLAREWVARLGDHVHFYKIGLELFAAGGALELADELSAQGKRIFLDLKLFDIPATVGAAVRQLRDRDAFVTVHGNDAILEAACREKGRLRILAVTVLTSLDKGDLEDLGFACDVPELVRSRARRARAVGCDGVVASGLEARALRADLGRDLVIVTPGIRPAPAEGAEPAHDDQRRTMTPAQAFQAGADHIVVGRPIRTAPDPAAAAQALQDEIAALFPAT